MHLIEQHRHENVRQVWLRTLKKVYNEGERIVDQRGNNVIRLHNVFVEIPYSWMLKCHIDNERMEDAFLDDLISPDMNTNFDYTYGQRLAQNRQIEMIAQELEHNINSRRCVATIFYPDDMSYSLYNKKEVPCATQLHFQHFRDKLHLHCIMRSNDIVGAMPSDMFGFGNLLQFMCTLKELEPGTFSYHIIDAHIILEHYEERLKQLEII